MTGYEFGDIVLVPFPFTDQSQGRAKPMVGDAAIGGWKEAGLLKPSSLKPLIATVEKRLVHRKLGRLQEGDRQALRGMLDTVLGG